MTRRTHDHEIKVDSTTKRLTLLRNPEGQAYYATHYEELDHQAHLRFIQNNWIGGLGQYSFTVPDMYFDGESIDTTQKGCVFLGPLVTEVKESDNSDLDSAVVDFLWFTATSEWLCATAGKIYRYDVGSNGKWTAATTTVAGVKQLHEHNGVAYAACGGSTAYYYSADGDTWTQTDLTDPYADRFFTAPNAAGTSNVLWKALAPNELCNTTSGTTEADGGVQWSSPAYIGDTTNNIINVFLINDQLCIGKEDGLIHYDSDGGLHYLLNDLRMNRSTNNFKYQCEWQSAVYFSLGVGLAEITSYQAYEPMGPLTDIDDIDKVGTCVGLTSDKDFLYVAYYIGSDTIIYKGREVRDEQGLRWQWCPWVKNASKTCAAMKVCQHSATDRKLWFGYGSNTAYVIITDNPLADTAARFAASGKVIMSYFDAGQLYHDKLWQSTITETEACTANLTARVYYFDDTDTSATAFSAAITTNGTVRTYASAAISDKRIKFEVDLATNSSSTSPVLRYFEARGVEKPVAVKIHEATYAVGDTESRSTETIRDFLETARTSTSLIRFADLRFGDETRDGGGYVWVVMQPGYPKPVEVETIKGQQPTLGIQCRFQEVDFTIT